jgi:hypothetical protein
MPFDADFLKLADRFLALIQKDTGCNSIVCDERGQIVRATVRSRIGTSHAGAQAILRNERDEYEVTAEEAAANPLVKEGYNCPIVVDGARVGTFGIGGPLALTRPLGRVAAVVLAAWVNELRQQRELRTTASRAFAAVDGLVASAARAGREAAASAAESGSAARAAAERIEGAGEVVRAVQRIAQQSRILSINGSVEATRAGDGGRSFGVVALEMTRLADETKAASGKIEAALGQIGAAVGDLSGALAHSAAAADAGSKALVEATAVVAGLRDAIERLQQSFGAARG